MAFGGEGLACRRGDRMVFEAIDFTIDPGELLVIRGANGSGKSSLLRLAATLLPPAAGTLRWDDVDVAEDVERYRTRLHYVGHQDAVKPLLTAAENVAVWARLRGRAAVADALSHFGIAHLSTLPARLLSAGQKKRVALARLLATQAPLWLLDEPTVSLDDDGLARLAAAIHQHCASGGLVMAATHADLGIAANAELRLGARPAP